MRLWSISPCYLDSKGLIALWRESLLCQAVLLKGEYTVCPRCDGMKWGLIAHLNDNVGYNDCPKCNGKGKIKTPYYMHPQLERFKDSFNQNAINIYLYHIWYEANKRGYKFNHSKIPQIDVIEQIKDLEHNKLTVTKGQLVFEISHLLKKLKTRDRKKYLEVSKEIEWREGANHLYYNENKIKANPIFKIIEGGVESWEKIK